MLFTTNVTLHHFALLESFRVNVSSCQVVCGIPWQSSLFLAILFILLALLESFGILDYCALPVLRSPGEHSVNLFCELSLHFFEHFAILQTCFVN